MKGIHQKSKTGFLVYLYKISKCPGISEKSQHGCVRWALREHLTPQCCDFACGRLEDRYKIRLYYTIMFINIRNFKGGGTDIYISCITNT